MTTTGSDGEGPGARGRLRTVHGPLDLPCFLPDATRAVVRTLDSADLEACGIRVLMVNILHLSSHPGVSTVNSAGGVHPFMGWPHPVMSDSGGFQVFSLISKDAALGSVSADGFSYKLSREHEKKLLSPEKCIRNQLRIGSDILFCLDHCTHPDQDRQTQRESVRNTVRWARRCREEFGRTVAMKAMATDARPLLFAVVQGGEDRDLRRECAEGLLEIGFDGYGFGGWPVDSKGNLTEAVGLLRELIPAEFPLHALGVGKPGNIRKAVAMGYSMFDCVLPTRDARQGRIVVRTEKGHGYLHIRDEKYMKDGKPLEDGCDCLCCSRYGRAYLHHLFVIGDALAMRLATIHNLRAYSRLMEELQAGKG